MQAEQSSALQFEFWQRGKDCYARAAGETEFHIGRETRYGACCGLFQPRDYGHRYAAADHEHRLGHWAHLLEFTGACESGNYFNKINTYDGVGLTFGFQQLAAHYAETNLILLFRRLLQLERAQVYFPDLRLVDGRVHQIKADKPADLETQDGRGRLPRFMSYLNPDPREVGAEEVLNAARLIHWTNNHSDMRQAQVDLAATLIRSKLRTAARKLPLDGLPDLLVFLVADILHQGRGRYTTIAAALRDRTPQRALLRIGAQRFPGRVQTLHLLCETLLQRGILGGRRYCVASNEFKLL